MATNQFAINMTRLLTEEGVVADHTKDYLSVPGLCYLNGVDPSLYGPFIEELGAKPLFADFCAKWVVSSPWDFTQDVFSVTHTCIDGDWNKVLIHIDIRAIGDKREKVRRRQFVTDVTRYLTNQGLITTTGLSSSPFEIRIGGENTQRFTPEFFLGSSGMPIAMKSQRRTRSPLFDDEDIKVWLAEAKGHDLNIPWVDWDQDMLTQKYAVAGAPDNTYCEYVEEQGACYLNLLCIEERANTRNYLGQNPSLERFLKYWVPEARQEGQVFALTWSTMHGSDANYIVHVDRHMGESDTRFKIRTDHMVDDLWRFVRVSGLLAPMCNAFCEVRIGGRYDAPKIYCDGCNVTLFRASAAVGDTTCEYCVEPGTYTRYVFLQRVEALKRGWHKSCAHHNKQTGKNLDRLGYFRYLIENNAKRDFESHPEALVTHDAAVKIYNDLITKCGKIENVMDTVLPSHSEKEQAESSLTPPKPSKLPDIVPLMEEEPELSNSGTTTPIRVATPTVQCLQFGDAPRVVNVLPERADSPVPTYCFRPGPDMTTCKRLIPWLPPLDDFLEEELGGVMDDGKEELAHAAFERVEKENTTTHYGMNWLPLPNWRSLLGLTPVTAGQSYADIVAGARKPAWHPVYDRTIQFKKVGVALANAIKPCDSPGFKLSYKRDKRGAHVISLTVASRRSMLSKQPKKTSADAPVKLIVQPLKQCPWIGPSRYTCLANLQSTPTHPKTLGGKIMRTIDSVVTGCNSIIAATVAAVDVFCQREKIPLLVRGPAQGNPKYTSWCAANLARKMYLIRCKQSGTRLRSRVTHPIPETIGKQQLFLRELIYGLDLTPIVWWNLLRWLKLNTRCPTIGTCWNFNKEGGYVEVLGWHGSGVSIRLDMQEIGHLGQGGSEHRALLDRILDQDSEIQSLKVALQAAKQVDSEHKTLLDRILDQDSEIESLKAALQAAKRINNKSITKLVDDKDLLTEQTELLLREVRSHKSPSMLDSVAAAKTHIYAKYTNDLNWLLGYRMTMQLGFTNVHSRSLNFTRPLSRQDNTLLTNRQKERFWGTDGHPLCFTMKGVAKVYMEKKVGSIWRKGIAKALGLTVSAAEKKLPLFLADETAPDLVMVYPSENMIHYVEPQEKEVPVYIEVPGVCLRCGDNLTGNHQGAQPVQPPPYQNVRPKVPRINTALKSPTYQLNEKTLDSLIVGQSPTTGADHNVSTGAGLPPLMSTAGPWEVDPLIARNSTKADIETNPGPNSGNELDVKHPTPEMERDFLKKSEHRRRASEIALENLRRRKDQFHHRSRSFSRPGDRDSATVAIQHDDDETIFRENLGKIEREQSRITRGGGRLDKTFAFPFSIGTTKAASKQNPPWMPFTPTNPEGSKANEAKSSIKKQFAVPTGDSRRPSVVGHEQRLSRSERIKDVIERARDKSRDSIRSLKRGFTAGDNKSREVSPTSRPHLHLDTQMRGRSRESQPATSASITGLEEEVEAHRRRKHSLRRSLSRVRTMTENLMSAATRHRSSSRSATREHSRAPSIVKDYVHLPDYQPWSGSFGVRRGYQKAFAYKLPLDYKLTATWPVRFVSAGAFQQLQWSLDAIESTGDAYVSDTKKTAIWFIKSYLDRLKSKQKKDVLHLTGSHFSAMAHHFKTFVDCPVANQGYAIDVISKENVIVFYEGATKKDCLGRLWWLMDGYELVHGGSPENKITVKDRIHNFIIKETTPGPCEEHQHSSHCRYVGQKYVAHTCDDQEEPEVYIPGLGATTNFWLKYPHMEPDCIPQYTEECYSNGSFVRWTYSLISYNPAHDLWPTNPKLHPIRRWHQKTRYQIKMFTMLEMDDRQGQDLGQRKAFTYALEYYLLLYVYFMFITWKNELAELGEFYQRTYFYPEFASHNESIREVRSDESHDHVEQRLLIAKMGTRGDQVPIDYLANVAASFGVKVDTLLYKDVTTTELYNLRHGKMAPLLPAYLELMRIDKSKYKRVLVPQIEVDRDRGLSYTLAPSSKWINEPTFITDWAKVEKLDTIISYISTLSFQVFKPSLRIGALDDCQFPRSIDGLTLLKTKESKRIGREGWTPGSAGEQVIPACVKDHCDPIPSGDHSELFREYDIVHTHGGAGTVQTIVASGATPIIWDPTLDRSYHTLPTQADIRTHTISIFMGWLVASGFDVDAPLFVKLIWWVRFRMHSWKDTAIHLLWLVAKAYIMIQGFYKSHLLWLIIITSMPTFVWRVITKRRSTVQIIGAVITLYWRHPVLFALLTNPFTVIHFVFLQEFWTELMQDIASFFKPKRFVIYTPLKLEGEAITLGFPVGHYLLWNKETDEYFEGRFRHTNKRTIDDPFKMVQITRPELPPEAKYLPVPWSESAVRGMLAEDYRPYGMMHNCATLAWRAAWPRSTLFTIVLTFSCLTIALLFSPGRMVKLFFEYFKPHVPESTWEQMWVIRVLGFAAGNSSPIESSAQAPSSIEQEPLAEFDQVSEADYELEPPLPQEIADLRDKDIEFLMAEIKLIISIIKDHRGEPANDIVLNDDDLHEAAMNTLGAYIEKVEFPRDAMRRYEELPYAPPTTWESILDDLHHAISFLRNTRFTAAFISWLKSIAHNIDHFIQPLLRALAYIFHLALVTSKPAADAVFKAVSRLIDKIWGLGESKRIKTVWGLTGLYRTGVLGAKAQMAREVAFASFTGRSDFETDFEIFIDRIKTAMDNAGKSFDQDKLGGPQRRPVDIKRPFGNKEWASILGFKEDEYDTTVDYEDRILSYLKEGVHQGVDGVQYAALHPEKLQASTDRYMPKYPEITSEEKARAVAVADVMFRRHPEVFANAEITRPEGVLNYLKKKYSPGIPFIKPGGYKSREAMLKAGFETAIKNIALQNLRTGLYPVKFYQSFGKAQVVDGKALLPVALGGKDKNVRTIVAQDLFTMVQDQVFQLERNKRATWETYGMGSGMPLNQTMGKIFERMYDLKQQFGGNYLVLDATEFDSRLTAFSSELNAQLWKRGFENHPSGNGAAFASQLAASYESKRNGWIIGITEPEYDSLTIAISDSRLRKFVESKYPDQIVPLATLMDFRKYNRLKEHEKREYIGGLSAPPGKVIMSWDPKLKPNRSNFMGKFEFGDTSKVTDLFFEHQTLRYTPGDWRNLCKDVEAILHANIPLVSNVHAKNRGAGTGEGDTSFYNTHSFRGTFIDAVCETKNITPEEVFVEMEENSRVYKEQGGTKINNTSDDSITWSGGKNGLVTVKDIHTFQEACRKRGIWLKLTTEKKITSVEYLSKFVRPPTQEDSETLQKWRSTKIKYLNAQRQQMKLPPVESLEQLNNPRFVVVQNPSAILLRRSAFRYYQSSLAKHKYVSVERGAGHAMNTAFCPSLYEKFGLEWCTDINSILREHKIHRRYEVKANFLGGMPGVQQVDTRAAQQALSPRQKAILEWVKQNLFPSYWKVVDVHMAIGSLKPEKHDHLMQKINGGWRGWDQIVREGVDWLFAMTDSIPDSWSKKFQPSIDMLYAEPTFYTHNHYTESFIYLRLLEEHTEEEVTFSVFNNRLMESPYCGTCDPFAFWNKLKDPIYRDRLLKAGHERYQGLVYLISALYACTTLIEYYIIYKMPVIGALYQLYMWSFIGLNKVYGLLNTMYWHSTGKSSRVISRLMPRDPYIVSKKACAFAIDLLPAEVGLIMLLPAKVMDLFPYLLDSMAKIWYLGVQVKDPDSPVTNKDNPWLAYTDKYIEALKVSPTRAVYIDAKTGTGKSSFFIAALNHYRQEYKLGKIWVLEPTRILHAGVTVPFQPSMQHLQKGVRLNPKADIYVCTYGHARMGRLPDMAPDDIVLFDEFHKLDGDILLALEQIPNRKFLLSATTVDIDFLAGSPFFKVPIQQRYPTTIYQMEEEMDVVQMFHLAHQRHPKLCDRALIVVPTKKMAREVRESLAFKYKELCDFTVVSKDQRIVPDHGCIIATPYVETGVDMKPPAKILIDSGITVKIDRGSFVYPLPKTDKDTNTQRLGRVGRLQEGIVYQNPGAGEGPDTISYPSPNFFQHKCIADHFKVPQLIPTIVPRVKELPYLAVNREKLNDISIEKSVVLIHTMAAQGVPSVDWERQYNDIKVGKVLTEEKELIRRVVDSDIYRGIPLQDYKDAQFHLHRPNVIGYTFLTKIVWALPLHPIRGMWVEVETGPSVRKVHRKLTNQWLKDREDNRDRRFENLKSALIQQASKLPTPTLLQEIEAL